MLVKQLLKNKDVEARSWDRKNLVWGRGKYEGGGCSSALEIKNIYEMWEWKNEHFF